MADGNDQVASWCVMGGEPDGGSGKPVVACGAGVDGVGGPDDDQLDSGAAGSKSCGGRQKRSEEAMDISTGIGGLKNSGADAVWGGGRG